MTAHLLNNKLNTIYSDQIIKTLQYVLHNIKEQK